MSTTTTITLSDSTSVNDSDSWYSENNQELTNEIESIEYEGDTRRTMRRKPINDIREDILEFVMQRIES